MTDIDDGPTLILPPGGRATAAGAAQQGDSAEVPAQIGPGSVLVHTYRIEKALGGGGMGQVYLARHLELGTLHAIKVIRSDFLQDARARSLFHREATVLRSLRHEAVVAYDGFFRDHEGRTFLVMEYVDGPSLAERIAVSPLSIEQVFALRDRLADGLHCAHDHGAVHRDISPDNIILPDNDVSRAVLIDFGLSKRCDADATTILAHDFAGKLRYASPEQLSVVDAEVDQRSDLYSLGLTLVTAVLGAPLRSGTTMAAMLLSVREPVNLASVPEPLRPMLEAMLQLQPADRPASMQDLLARWPARSGHGRVPRDASGVGAGERPGWTRTIARPAIALAVSALVIGGLWLQREQLAVLMHEGQGATTAGGSHSAAAPKAAGADPAGIGDRARDGTDRSYAEVVDRIDALRTEGRLQDAFALVQTLVADALPLPRDEVYDLAGALRESGALDRGFALTRELAVRGDGNAAFDLAEMYDPVFWDAARSPFSRPNPEEALQWYRRAQERGVDAATERLERLARRDAGVERGEGQIDHE